jgi:hypothetical protein
MTIKSYIQNDKEIKVVSMTNDLYKVIRKVKSNDSQVVTGLDYDFAMATFDYFLDKELGVDK